MVQSTEFPRRSGRKITRTSKYVNDALSELQPLGIVRDGEAFPEDTSSSQPSEASSEGFDPEDAGDKSEYDDGISSGEDVPEGEVSDDDRIASDNSDAAETIDGELLDRPSTRSRGPRASTRVDLHSRGLQFDTRGKKTNVHLLSALGDSDEDINPMVKAEEKWRDQATMPSRLPNESGTGGFAETFFQTDAERASISITGWSWYHEGGGRAAFDRHTQTTQLEADQALPYLYHRFHPLDFVWGPIPHQSLFNLPPHHSVHLHKSWVEVCKGIEEEQSSHIPKPPSSGWAINLGELVHQLYWLPNRPTGPQYLSLATWSKESVDRTATFESSASLPTSIQIWEFLTATVANGALTFDDTEPPRLTLVLCFNWGNVKQFKWCPVPRDNSYENSPEVVASLGLLAVITDDGKVRVLDVKSPNIQKSNTEYRHYSSAAFESCPPDTVCTCLAWISSTLIAAGCANGYVAIWDISSHLLKLTDPFPILYHSFHMSSVRAIASSQPSRSNFLSTSAMDGTIRLTDIRDPKFDSVFSVRSRNVCPALSWHEQSQHFLSADDTYMLKGLHLRLFFRYTFISSLESCPLSLATSPVHPFLLVGEADGAVTIMNPLGRLLDRRKRQPEYVGRWLKHEWRRGRADPAPPVEEETINAQPDQGQSPNNSNISFMTPATAKIPPLDFPNGLARLTVGYAPKRQPVRPSESGIAYATIHEEVTGVYSVAWNPNLSCGGWAAAGTGSGLVIVQDLAVDP